MIFIHKNFRIGFLPSLLPAHPNEGMEIEMPFDLVAEVQMLCVSFCCQLEHILKFCLFLFWSSPFPEQQIPDLYRETCARQ